jgi:hypothetical protein
VVAGTAGLAAVGVGTSYAVGAIPGSEAIPQALSGLVAGTARGLTALTSNLPLLAIAGVALVVLLKT